MSKLIKTGLGLAGAMAVCLSAQAGETAEPMQLAVADGTPTHCYNFDKLPVDSVYEVGQKVQAQNALIRLMDYTVNGQLSTADSQKAEVRPSKIAGGEQPELRTYLIVPRVELDTPVRRVTMKVAEANSGPAPHNNLAVNNERHEIDGSLAMADGWLIGGNPFNRARVTVNLTEATVGNWNKGTIEITAVSGPIRNFGVGGLQTFIDEVCVYE